MALVRPEWAKCPLKNDRDSDMSTLGAEQVKNPIVTSKEIITPSVIINDTKYFGCKPKIKLGVKEGSPKVKKSTPKSLEVSGGLESIEKNTQSEILKTTVTPSAVSQKKCREVKVLSKDNYSNLTVNYDHLIPPRPVLGEIKSNFKVIETKNVIKSQSPNSTTSKE